MLSHFDMKGAWMKAEEGWRKYFGFEAHVALRGRRSHMQHERKVLLRAAEKENEFLKGRVTSEIQPQSTSYESVPRELEVQ